MDTSSLHEDSRTGVSTLQVRPLQIIYGAAASAVITFFLVLVALLSSDGGGSENRGETSLTALALSMVHLLIGVTVYAVSPKVFRSMCTRKSTPGAGAQTSGASEGRLASGFASLQRALIIRLALMESVALFGLVVCLIALAIGVLAEEPLYWLNLASAAVFVGFLAATFPTVERLQILLRESISVPSS